MSENLSSKEELTSIMKQETNKETQQVLNFYSEDFFGSLYPYIADIDVTDINCNGRHVWINHVINGRYKATDITFNNEDIKSLAYRVSNTEGVQFNASNPEFSADLHDLRFQFTHESFSVSGATASIRKTPTIMRINDKNMELGEVKYLSKRARKLIENCIQADFNHVFCGMTGSGKTEAIKYTCQFTAPENRIITIEDTSELHLVQLYPEKDIVELKVNEFIGYARSISTSMRMLPFWLLLSEARGAEIKYLLQSASTGAKLITSLHADDAHQIPKRILSMFEENELSNEKIENMVYDFIDIGIHIRAEFRGKTVRFVDQIVYYEIDQDSQKKQQHDLYRVDKNADGSYTYNYFPFPESMKKRLAYRNLYPEWEEKEHEKAKRSEKNTKDKRTKDKQTKEK